MEIRPFRGIRYNQGIVGDLAAVICPPYDIITPEQQKSYYRKSDYNAIRLEYPLTQDIASLSVGAGLVPAHAVRCNDKYSRAAISFQQWLKQGVLQIDDCPAFYLHDHYFTYLGKERRRRGLIARGKLEPWGTSIYPHEETFFKAKDDRLQLMRACRANFSPLFSLFQDHDQKIASILAEASQVKPIIDISIPCPSMGERQGEGGERHIVWAIIDSSLVRQISYLMAARPLYMADGHHRYETALTYQQERRSCHSERSEESRNEAFDYTMMELVAFSDPGLVILPVHRLVRGIAPPALAGLRNQLEDFFTLDFIPLPEVLPCHSEPFASSSVIASEAKQSHLAQDKLREESRPFASPRGMVLGILGSEPQSLVVLKLRQGIPLEAMMPGNRSQAYKEFSISLLNHIILDRMLGLPSKEDIAYTVDSRFAYQQIKEGRYQLAFLLNPPQPGIVKAIADAKDKLPRKSTYFYPKLPAGLIINPLD